MSYLEKLKSKTNPPGELQKPQKDFETENIPTSPTAKTAKNPFYTFCSDPGSRFSENEVFNLKIMPMTVCLDGKKCRHLDAPGEKRPICSKAGAAVFDLTACPLDRWAERQQTKR